jgi:hypothetical protein
MFPQRSAHENDESMPERWTVRAEPTTASVCGVIVPAYSVTGEAADVEDIGRHLPDWYDCRYRGGGTDAIVWCADASDEDLRDTLRRASDASGVSVVFAPVPAGLADTIPAPPPSTMEVA